MTCGLRAVLIRLPASFAWGPARRSSLRTARALVQDCTSPFLIPQDGCVADFWAGVVAGVLGAFVGGFFTAWGARLQVRGTLEAVRLEIEATADADRKARQIALRRQALTEMYRTVGNCLHLLEVEAEKHEDHARATGCEIIPPTDLLQARRDLECTYWTYNNELMLDSSHDATPIDDLTLIMALLCSKDKELLQRRIEEMPAKMRQNNCEYRLLVDWEGATTAFAAWEYLGEVRKTIDA